MYVKHKKECNVRTKKLPTRANGTHDNDSDTSCIMYYKLASNGTETLRAPDLLDSSHR